MNTNKKIVLILIVVLIVLGAFAAAVTYKLMASSAQEESDYSAVYLTTGDVYFGKLSWIPWPHLTNVWFLQKGQSVSVVPLKKAFWGPTDEVYLNPKEIVLWTKLSSASQMVYAFEHPELLKNSNNP